MPSSPQTSEEIIISRVLSPIEEPVEEPARAQKRKRKPKKPQGWTGYENQTYFDDPEGERVYCILVDDYYIRSNQRGDPLDDTPCYIENIDGNIRLLPLSRPVPDAVAQPSSTAAEPSTRISPPKSRPPAADLPINTAISADMDADSPLRLPEISDELPYPADDEGMDVGAGPAPLQEPACADVDSLVTDADRTSSARDGSPRLASPPLDVSASDKDEQPSAVVVAEPVTPGSLDHAAVSIDHEEMSVEVERPPPPEAPAVDSDRPTRDVRAASSTPPALVLVFANETEVRPAVTSTSNSPAAGDTANGLASPAGVEEMDTDDVGRQVPSVAIECPDPDVETFSAPPVGGPTLPTLGQLSPVLSVADQDELERAEISAPDTVLHVFDSAASPALEMDPDRKSTPAHSSLVSPVDHQSPSTLENAAPGPSDIVEDRTRPAEHSRSPDELASADGSDIQEDDSHEMSEKDGLSPLVNGQAESERANRSVSSAPSAAINDVMVSGVGLEDLEESASVAIAGHGPMDVIPSTGGEVSTPVLPSPDPPLAELPGAAAILTDVLEEEEDESDFDLHDFGLSDEDVDEPAVDEIGHDHHDAPPFNTPDPAQADMEPSPVDPSVEGDVDDEDEDGINPYLAYAMDVSPSPEVQPQFRAIPVDKSTSLPAQPIPAGLAEVMNRMPRWQYLSDDTRIIFEEMIAEASAEREPNAPRITVTNLVE